jgi:hypothetical protein
MILETLLFLSLNYLTCLVAQEYFIIQCRRESYNSYNKFNFGPYGPNTSSILCEAEIKVHLFFQSSLPYKKLVCLNYKALDERLSFNDAEDENKGFAPSD